MLKPAYTNALSKLSASRRPLLCMNDARSSMGSRMSSHDNPNANGTFWTLTKLNPAVCENGATFARRAILSIALCCIREHRNPPQYIVTRLQFYFCLSRSSKTMHANAAARSNAPIANIICDKNQRGRYCSGKIIDEIITSCMIHKQAWPIPHELDTHPNIQEFASQSVAKHGIGRHAHVVEFLARVNGAPGIQQARRTIRSQKQRH
jgi:hypothetical protein